MQEKKTLTQAITDILIRDGVVSSIMGDQLEQLFKDSDKDSFAEFLIDDGLADRRDVLDALSEYYQVPWFDTNGYFFNHMLLHEFPKDFLLRNNIIPIEVDEDILVLAASDPGNSNLLPLIGSYASYDVRFEVGLARDIQDAIKEFYDEDVSAQSHAPDDLDWEEDHRLIKEEERLEEDEIEKDRPVE
ncbi:MAG TPA: hypothetical protein VGW78_01230 [Candidatus Babeliales bacterium]|jgi:hypothetical protein|nr:hypothetical protein [Candidatus Babeliales bacterium]